MSRPASGTTSILPGGAVLTVVAIRTSTIAAACSSPEISAERFGDAYMWHRYADRTPSSKGCVWRARCGECVAAVATLRAPNRTCECGNTLCRLTFGREVYSIGPAHQKRGKHGE